MNKQVVIIIALIFLLISVHQPVVGAGFDLSAPTVEAIRGGWTDLVIDQQQWLQGYLSILQICLTDNFAFTGLHIDTGAGFAHAENVELLADLVERQIR